MVYRTYSHYLDKVSPFVWMQPWPPHRHWQLFMRHLVSLHLGGQVGIFCCEKNWKNKYVQRDQRGLHLGLLSSSFISRCSSACMCQVVSESVGSSLRTMGPSPSPWSLNPPWKGWKWKFTTHPVLHHHHHQQHHKKQCLHLVDVMWASVLRSRGTSLTIF